MSLLDLSETSQTWPNVPTPRMACFWSLSRVRSVSMWLSSSDSHSSLPFEFIEKEICRQLYSNKAHVVSSSAFMVKLLSTSLFLRKVSSPK